MGKVDRFGLAGNTIAGTFRVDGVVAEGGFGIVYRAFHLHFRAPVALKCLKIPGELSEEERQAFLEQFRSEAEIMFRLSASLPNIVRPLHVDAVLAPSGEFVPIMALEWLEGRSFEKIIEERSFGGLAPLPLTEVLELLGPAAKALDAAHHFEGDEGTLVVVHRDIKPDNLFLTNVGGKPHVKILDFGISKIRRTAAGIAGRVSETSGQAPFSPAYGAPEQWVPKRFGQTGPWTDVWGLALTLIEIIKGDAVIVGDHQAMMGTALDPRVRPTPRREGVEVTDEIESVFEKALALDPRYRYQSVKDFWSALGRAVELGGDPTLERSSPSASKIQLPPMVAPTPWTPPLGARPPGAPAFAGLPAMMAPAPLEVRPSDPPDSPPSYPRNPLSGLAPLPAAEPSQADDLLIPALDEVTPAPATFGLQAGPPPSRQEPPPGAELQLELDEEALAEVTRPDLNGPGLLPLGQESLAQESIAPASIDLPSDFPPVELTPVHAARHVDSPLRRASGKPPAPLREQASPEKVQSEKALRQKTQPEQVLPEVPDLAPRSRGRPAPAPATRAGAPSPGAYSLTSPRGRAPAASARGEPPPPTRQSPPPSPEAGRPGAHGPSRVNPPSTGQGPDRPPPPPKREKAR